MVFSVAFKNVDTSVENKFFLRNKKFLCAQVINKPVEGSWSEMFRTLPSLEFYCDYIVACLLFKQCLHSAFAYCSIPFSLMLVIVGLLGTSSMC